MTEIGFAVDRYMEDCAYVAIHSMLRRASKKVSVIVFYEAGNYMPGTNWKRKLDAEGFDFELRHQAIDITPLRHCKDMFNSWTNYLRIYMPLFATQERFIYSDVDTVFTEDIEKLQEVNLNEALIGLVAFGYRPCSGQPEREKRVLLASGHLEDDNYFSNPIAVIDTKAYLAAKIIQKCEDIAKTHAGDLVVVDQTLWNCGLASHQVIALPQQWCQPVPISKEDGPSHQYAPGMIHFAGTPKPWDLFGEILHVSFHEWYRHAKNAKMRHQTLTKYFHKRNIQKFLRIRKQYARFFR